MSSVRSMPWLYSAPIDGALIFFPSLLAILGILIFKESVDQTTQIPMWAWVLFILCIDVVHVYSTLFRTYFNENEFNQNRSLLTIVPLLAWLAGMTLYAIDESLFWRVLAYVAVFHFVRQQYGFMRLYSRHEDSLHRRFRWIDGTLIYLATIYPLVYWHTHLPRNFHWFVEGDFWGGMPQILNPIALSCYVLFGVLYLLKEVILYFNLDTTTFPKHLIILSTALTWYVGIVYLNGDMAFTITNVVSHGVPYLGLVWIYGRKTALRNPESSLRGRLKYRHLFVRGGFVFFFLVLVLLAYIEEGLWDGLIWREKTEIFAWFSHLPQILDRNTLIWLVPLLSLPQVTHYILDGFIWKVRDLPLLRGDASIKKGPSPAAVPVLSEFH